MYGFYEGNLKSDNAKEIFEEIIRESDMVFLQNSTYADLMVKTENAYHRDNLITREDYIYLNNFIAKCCEQNALKNQQNVEMQNARQKNNSKNSLWNFFHKKKNSAMNKNEFSNEEISNLRR